MKIFALLTILSIPLCSPVSAKCTMPSINVSGKVAYENGEAASGAVVALSWVVKGAPQGPVQGQTDTNGHFNLSFSYNTHTKSSWLRGDICREKVTEVSASAYALGYLARPVLAHVASSSARVQLVLALVSVD